MPITYSMISELKYSHNSKYYQDEIYDYCDKLWAIKEYTNVRFNRFSPSYLFSTELPWLSWPENLIDKNSKVLSIAGSGDPILFFISKGIWDITAVDVSYHSCMWNELKRQIISLSSRKEIRALYEAIISGQYEDSCLFENIYSEAIKHLSNRARKYWLSIMDNRFEIKQLRNFLRPSDTLFADMIFYIRDQRCYQNIKNNLSSFPIYNLPIEWFLETLSRRYFDMIYLSNVGEYVRAELSWSAFRYLIDIAKKALVPGGVICLYESTRKSNIVTAYSKLEENTQIIEFTLRPRDGFVFKHCLVFVWKS